MITARSNGNLRKKKPFKVLVCIVTLVAFLFNTVSYDAALLRPLGFVGQAWAVETPSEFTGSGSDSAGDPGLIKDINVANFTLPKDLGSVTNSYAAAKPDKVVIHIQDAHCNYAAQHQISKIIEYVNKEYGVVSVNLEGGAKGYDLSAFAGISDKAIKNKVADYFMKEGLVNGAEYYAINNPEKTSLWGVEDVKLYIDGLAVYRNSLHHKEEIDKYLKSLNNIISNLKAKIYSRELLDFDMKYGAHKANNMELKEYLSYLLGAAKTNGVDTKRLANIYLLDQVFTKEANIDFKKANKERDDLIDGLQKKLSKNAVEELIMETMKFKQERTSQKSFYAYLMAKAEKAGVDMAAFPELQRYIAYISIYGAMDEAKIMEEKEELEDTVKGVLCRNDKEKELSLLSKNLALLKNIFNISLAKDDYRYYLANKDSFNVSRYSSFIDTEAPLHKITAALDKDASSLDHYREELSQFYEYSLKRDEIFLKNMKYVTNGDNKSVAILVTGGFHNENLAELFKREGIAYVSIMPNFKNTDGYECPYFKILSGKESDLVTSLDEALGTMQVASLYNALGVAVDENAAKIARILPLVIAYVMQKGPFAIHTTTGYLVLDSTYHFSLKKEAGDITVVNKDMPIDTHDTKKILLELSKVGAAVSNEEAPQAPAVITTHEMTAENPVYLAFCLLFEPKIDTLKIKTDEHFAVLARSFGVSKIQARKAVDIRDSMEIKDILKAVIDGIQNNLKSPQVNQPEFFFQNVLLPYLTIVSRKFMLDDSLEYELNAKFREVFNTGRDNPLAEFVKPFRGYLMDRSLHVDHYVGHLNNLNAALKTHDFRVEAGRDYSVGYKIAAKIGVDSINVGSVLILSRFGVSLLNDAKGLSTINEKDVVISLDHMNQETEHIKDAAQEGKAPLLYFPAAEDMFGKIGIWLTTAEGDRILLTAPEANRILNSLYNKQFDGMAERELKARIAYNTVVHETKHKWEEKNADMSRLNIDSEVSAHLAAAIYGGAPPEGLVSLINRLELYYLNIEDASVKSVIRLLMQDAWNLAYKFDQGTIDEAELIDGLKNMYNSYICIGTGRSLPLLGGFESEVLPRISLQKIREGLDIAFGLTSPITPSQAQSSILTGIIPFLEAQKIDRLALVRAMVDKAKDIEGIRNMLSAIETLPIEQRPEAQMAIRTAVAVRGVGDLEPGHLNIVVQCAGLGDGNAATNYNRKIEDILSRRYNGALTKSIIGEDINDIETLGKILVRARETLDSSKDPSNSKVLLLLPQSLKDIFKQAAEKASVVKDGIVDERFSVQFVDQGTMPDYVNQFILGLEMLEYVRSGAKPNEASQRLINLLAAMADGQDPQDILKKLFEFGFILKIRKINWQGVVEQRKAWEAVATAL